jgi:hypothetical protein
MKGRSMTVKQTLKYHALNRLFEQVRGGSFAVEYFDGTPKSQKARSLKADGLKSDKPRLHVRILLLSSRLIATSVYGRKILASRVSV